MNRRQFIQSIIATAVSTTLVKVFKPETAVAQDSSGVVFDGIGAVFNKHDGWNFPDNFDVRNDKKHKFSVWIPIINN